jgi:polysaccharide export outer membrane protein
MKRAFAGLAVTVLSLLLAACATSSGSEAPPPATTTLGTDAYHIGVDDIVQVSVWRNPELGITVPVRPDGMISVPLVGDVAAGGRTPGEVAKDIQERLATYVRDPQVAVILTDLRSHASPAPCANRSRCRTVPA